MVLRLGAAQSQERESNSRERLLARVDGGIRDLLGEMQQGKSDRLVRYLEFSSRFHKYSLHNQLLIYLQRPNATFVAGYRKWQEMGYQVAKGEKAIHILAPHSYRLKEEETEEVREVLFFKSVAVFDASQMANLDEKPLPLFFTPLADDHQELAERLMQTMKQDRIQVTDVASGLTQGMSRKGRVFVREGLDSTNKVLTLLHEYTHELLHWTAEGKRQPMRTKECHAEAVAFVVAHHFGIHNPFSADYLQHWGNTRQELYAELDIVRRTAAYMIQRLEVPTIEVNLVDETMIENA